MEKHTLYSFLIFLLTACMTFFFTLEVLAQTEIRVPNPPRNMGILGPEPSGIKKARELIERYGPIIYFHPDEKYFLDDPVYVLDRSAILYGLVSDEDFDNYMCEIKGYKSTSSNTLITDLAYIKENALEKYYLNFKYWLDTQYHFKDIEKQIRK